MDQNGRIGGEPVGPEGMEMIEPEDDLPFDISELQVVDDEVEMAEGGYLDRAMNREEPINRFESLLQFLFKDKDEYGETPIDRYKEQMGDDDMGFFESFMANPIERGERKWGKKGYAPGGDVTATPVPQNPFSPTGSTGGFEIKEYVNDAGEVMYIQFMNGQPMTFIPQGFKPKDSVAQQAATGAGVAAQAAPTTSPTTASDSGNDYDSGAEMGKVDESFTQGASAKDWTKASVDDFAKATKQLGTPGVIGSLAGALLPGPVGVAVGIGSQSQARVKAYDMIDGIAYQLESGNLSDQQRTDLIKQKEALQEIVSTSDDGDSNEGFLGKSGIYGGQSSMYERLDDTSGDGRVSFADTWLGDLLGADGKAGVQGASLSESRAGARRTGAFDTYEGDRDRAAERISEREPTKYEKAMTAAKAAPAGSAEQKEAYSSASDAARDSWIAAGNAAAALQRKGDVAGARRARMAQSAAGKAATEAKRKETGWTGFFSPPKKDKKDED
jgi:outer membrane lipoprotein SlyB